MKNLTEYLYSDSNEIKVEEALQVLERAEKELAEALEKQRLKVEPLYEVYRRSEEKVRRFQELRREVQDLYTRAQTALKNCDHSETEVAILHTHLAYKLLKEIPRKYQEAAKIQDRYLREAILTLIDGAYSAAYTALVTGQKHLNTPKQRPLRDAYMKEFRTAIYGYD